ncbi:PREDICTED: AAC-rich mRNA clone AAC11 protein-like, partial [Rhagoletis zephyria]|uniref:AAC-rich mRNA clone AAC11 protein-like n=1 Tax=Rhagoletis zephyria TaxID=28612 RepID=UPI0008112BC2
LNNALYFSGNQFPEVTSESNARIALKPFKYGLPEPVKSIIVSRNPKSLKEAYDIIKSNGYLKYKNQQFSFNRAQYNYRNNSEQRSCNISNYANQQHAQNTNNSTNNHGQQNHNSTPTNFSLQSRLTSNSSNLTNRTQNSSRKINSTNNYQANNNNNQRFNANQNHSRLRNEPLTEPMDVGVNENTPNFQLDGHENYPI